MNIFLTGGTGHTGSRTARRLVERGHDVTCLLRTPERRNYLPEKANIINGDVAEIDSFRDVLSGVDVFIHFAHIRYVKHVIRACVENNVRRMICISSTRRYTRFPCESSRAVIEGEQAVEESDLEYTILRPSMIYGGWRDNNMGRLVRYFQKRRIFPLLRGGRNLVQPVFAEDVVDALESALRRDIAKRCAYTIAGPEALTYRRMMETAAETANTTPLLVPTPYLVAIAGAWAVERLLSRPPATTESIRRLLEDKTFDIQPARNDLGYSPRSFEEGMRDGEWRITNWNLERV